MSLNPEGPARQRRGVVLLGLGEDLYCELAGPIQRMPRSHRYRAGADLEQMLRQLNDLIIEAVSSRGQPSKVFRLHEHCRKVGSRLATAARLELIRPSVIGNLSRPPSGKKDDMGGTFHQIKAMVGSWRESILESKREGASKGRK